MILVKSVIYGEYDGQNRIAKAGTGAGRFETDPRTFTKSTGFTPNMMATFALSPIAFNGEQRARNGRAARAASRRHGRHGADVRFRAVRQ
jgi:hypothetical protein